MALIKCKECGAEVSSKAETCPKCGARVAAKPMGCGTLVGIAFLGVIIISIFSSIFSTDQVSGTSDAEESSTSTTSSQTVAMPEPLLARNGPTISPMTIWGKAPSTRRSTQARIQSNLTFHIQASSTLRLLCEPTHAGVRI